MKSVKVLALAMLFLLTSMIPVINVEAAKEERRETDIGYISEKWRAGLGTGLGSLNSIKSADIDADGEDELVFCNSQGFIARLQGPGRDWEGWASLARGCTNNFTESKKINNSKSNSREVVVSE